MKLDFTKIRAKIEQLQETDVAKKHSSIRRIIDQMETEFNKFSREVDGNLKEILPKIRRSEEARSNLSDLISKYQKSAFYISTLDLFFDPRQREIETIQHIRSLAG